MRSSRSRVHGYEQSLIRTFVSRVLAVSFPQLTFDCGGGPVETGGNGHFALAWVTAKDGKAIMREHHFNSKKALQAREHVTTTETVLSVEGSQMVSTNTTVITSTGEEFVWTARSKPVS